MSKWMNEIKNVHIHTKSESHDLQKRIQNSSFGVLLARATMKFQYLQKYVYFKPEYREWIISKSVVNTDVALTHPYDIATQCEWPGLAG